MKEHASVCASAVGSEQYSVSGLFRWLGQCCGDFPSMSLPPNGHAPATHLGLPPPPHPPLVCVCVYSMYVGGYRHDSHSPLEAESVE